MTDRQSITEVWQKSDNSFVRMIEANRRQQAIDEAVRRVFTPTIIEWWKEGKMPAFAIGQVFEEIGREFSNIMAAT